MATMNQTNAAPFGAISTYRATRAVEAAVNSLVMWRAKRKTYSMLDRLTNRELEDIGMTRADVEAMNTGFFRQM